MIKAVVFDMDGVLFDTERLCKECYCQIAKELHLPDMDKVFDTFIGRNVVDTKRMFEEHYIEQVSFDEFDEMTSALARRKAYAIEDSFNGIRSAHRAGMKPIMVPDLLSPDSEMRELSFCICDDLLKVLEEKSLWQV